MNTIVRVFSETIYDDKDLNQKLNAFLTERESEGYRFTDKTVHIARPRDTSRHYPQVVITVWMEKDA